jgi:hypothetical protein
MDNGQIMANGLLKERKRKRAFVDVSWSLSAMIQTAWRWGVW